MMLHNTKWYCHYGDIRLQFEENNSFSPGGASISKTAEIVFEYKLHYFDAIRASRVI